MATIVVAIVAGAAAGSVTTQFAHPQSASALGASALGASDIAQLKRIVGRLDVLHEDVATLDSRVGANADIPGVWGEIHQLRRDQAKMCRALTASGYEYLCPTL